MESVQNRVFYGLVLFEKRILSMRIKAVDHLKPPNLIARVLSPLGVYPEKTIVADNYAYYSSPEICFTVVFYEKFELKDENYYSEMEWAHIEEIKLFASLILAVDRDMSFIRMYPFPCTERLGISGELSLKDKDLLTEIKEFLVGIINAPDKQIPGYPASQRNRYQNAKGISLPPVCGGPAYDFRGEGINYKLQSKVHSAISKDDYLAIRGLSTLIKSFMLSTHYQFLEESTYSLFISLEASFRMVLRELRKNGVKDPSSSDAMQYIHNAFYDIYRIDKYFEEYYEGRIKSMHPESRFGIFPHAPLMVDDFYHLADDLLEVYAFLLAGYVNPKHKEKHKF